MANKEYGSKLTLKDNFSAVMSKAIQMTEKLQQSIKKTEGDITKLSGKKVKIGAEMDSSVHTTMNRINRTIVPNKTIKVNAENNVTRTITNIQRDIFKMNNDINYNMRNPFQNFSMSASSASQQVSHLVNGMTMMNNMARMAGGSALLAATAAGGATGVVMRGGDRGIAQGVAHAARRSPVVPKEAGKGIWGALKGGIYDAIANAKNRELGYILDSDVLSQMPGVSKAWENDSNFAKMIARQKAEMAAKGGSSSYLSKFKSFDLFGPTGGGTVDEGGQFWPNEEVLFSGIIKEKNKVQKALDSIRQSVSKFATDTRRVLSRAFDKVWNSSFVTQARTMFNQVINFAQRTGMRIGHAFERGTYHASNAISKVVVAASKIGSKIKPIVLKIQDSAVGKAIANVASKLKTITSKVWKVTLAAVDKVSGVLKGITGKLAALAKGGLLAAGAAATAGAYKAITGAASLEQDKLSIAHFIGYGNTKKHEQGKESLLSKDDINAKTDAYVNRLRDHANATPFATGEIIEAGRRAVTIMTGDTGEAEKLVKIASDMAALNPGRSVMDAMEALGDLKMGETARLKNFGLKISNEEIAALVGKGSVSEMNEEELDRAYKQIMDNKLTTMFGGGSAKLSETAAGKWSTVMGKLQSSLTDIGTMFLPFISTALSGLIDKMDAVAPKVLSFFEGIVANKDKLQPLADVFKSVFGGIGSVVTMFVDSAVAQWPRIQKALEPVIATFQNLFGNVGQGMPAMQNVISGVMNTVAVVIEALAPVVSFVSELIVKMMGAVASRIGVVSKVISYLGKIWADIWPTIQDILSVAWGIIEPIFKVLMDTASIIADIFMLVWPGIKLAIDALWAGIKPVLQLIQGALEGVAWVAEKVSKFTNWLLGNGDKAADKAKGLEKETSSSTGNSREKAVGMSYIPYNGYGITAHRGEAILTRAEAEQWREGRNGNGSGGVVINIHDPVVRDDSDFDRLGTVFAQKLKEVMNNGGAVPAV